MPRGHVILSRVACIIALQLPRRRPVLQPDFFVRVLRMVGVTFVRAGVCDLGAPRSCAVAAMLCPLTVYNYGVLCIAAVVTRRATV